MSNHKFVKIYIPDDLISTYEGKTHQKPEQWNKIVFYNSRVREEIDRKNIVNELVGCGQYQKNTFYKMGSISKKDYIWDYYRVLKKHPYSEIAVKTDNPKRFIKKPWSGFKITRFPKGEEKIISFQ